jgi:hypothetical protein
MPVSILLSKRTAFDSQSLRRQTLGQMKRIFWVFFVAAAVMTPRGSWADELGDSRFAVRGFGTLGAVTHDTDGVEFRRNTGQARGAEAGRIDFGTDSIAGVQLDARLSSKFDVVLQGVSRQRADGDWAPQVTQGFVRWSPDDSFVVRAGRVGYDIYLLAESRQVGYSYLAVRPSPEFYGQITNDDIDGADLSFTRRAGRGLLRARVFGGDGSGELVLADGSRKNARGGVYGATFDYLWRGWTARLAYVQFNYEAGKDVPLLVNALRATQVPGALAVADDLDSRFFRSDGVQIGAAYDDGPVLAQVMYGGVISDSIAGPNFDKFYGLFGYHLGELTPFVAFASSRDREPIRGAGLPPIPQLAPLDAAVIATQEATRSTQRTTSLGVRYDFTPHFDLKLQVDRLAVTDSSIIFDRRPAPRGPVDLTVISAAVDFVF